MPDIPFRELPGFSTLFCDYAEGAAAPEGTRLPTPDLASLLHSARAAREGADEALGRFFQLARESGCTGSAADTPVAGNASVAVWAAVAPHPAAGVLSDLLRALTAVALCRRLAAESIDAAAVIVVEPADPSVPVRLVAPDAEGRLRSIERAAEAFPRDAVSGLVGPGAEIGPEELLWGPGPTSAMTRAFVGYLSALLRGTGALVVDSAALRKAAAAKNGEDGGEPFRTGWALRARSLSLAGYSPGAGPLGEAKPGLMDALPVAAVVSGPDDLAQALCRAGGLESAGRHPPLPWPRLSATLVDARSRKFLGRHGLRVQDLLAGHESVLARLGLEEARRETLARIESIEESIRRRVLSHAPAAGMEKELEAAASSLLYQTGRLRERFGPLMAQRLDSVARQLARLCELVTPEGRLQESVLSLPWFLHRFSNALPGLLLERLDPFELQHRVVEME